MDNHSIENEIPFILRLSSYSSLYEKEMPYFYSNHQPVSSCFPEAKPKEVLLNTHILRNTGFSARGPTDRSIARWTRQRYKGNVGGLYFIYELPRLSSSFFLKTAPKQVSTHPSLSPNLTALNPKALRLQKSPNIPDDAQGPANLSPDPGTSSFCHRFSGLWYHRQKGKSTYPYLIKINVTSECHTEVLFLNPVFKETLKSHQLYFVNLCKSL